MKYSAFTWLFMIVIVVLCSCGASRNGTATNQNPDVWFKKGAWASGLKLKTFRGINKQEFYRQYHANPDRWDKAFAFLRDSDLKKIAPGKYELDGTNVFASVTEGPLHEFDKTAWEFHKDYIDVQYIIRGKEKIGVAPVAGKTGTDFGDINKEAAVYYIAQPDTMYIFFPHDAHRPTIQVDGVDKVKKVVVKVKAAP
jgi:biofilm protein TabA